jgi:microcin C transport system permease protein
MPPYPFHPNESLLLERDLQGEPPHPPTGRHWLGTDDRGRDVFARLAYGFRISITFALAVVALSYAIGITVGAVFGFFGGKTDIIGQRMVEIWAALPFLYTMIIVSSILRPNVALLAILLALFGWVGLSFYVRGEFYREKAKDYVAAAIAQGESDRSVMFRHILPNALTPVISFAPFAMVADITALVSLDFLGFGLPAPTPSWGELMGQGLGNLSEWHLILFPLTALFLTLIMVVFIGEAVRQAFDPRAFSRLR